jgi:hypothetical protein
LASRDNYPYLGFNNTCRIISQDDLRPLKDVPSVRQYDQFLALVEFWTLYYLKVFLNLPEFVETTKMSR